jgi:hypothetical protein
MFDAATLYNGEWWDNSPRCLTLDALFFRVGRLQPPLKSRRSEMGRSHLRSMNR